MTDIEKQIEELTRQLAEMRNRQLLMNEELSSVEKQLQQLKASFSKTSSSVTSSENVIAQTPSDTYREVPYIVQVKQNLEQKKVLQQKRQLHISGELEDFIGTNVISKIGILVTIIGVFIGAKYAIDNELISPLMRIISGYVFGAALVSVAFRLKKKYEYFSSILIGGGLAVTYFITYIAYSFYGLLPVVIAFGLMIIATAAAVAIALWYNQKVIALIGQVAAYAIPFLLANNKGNIFALLTYISVINFGLLLLSFKKDWKLLYHIAFFLTWLIYAVSSLSQKTVTSNLPLSLTFLSINFFTFYGTFLSYKVYRKELYKISEIAILLLNALFFFFLGTYLVQENYENIHALTWFTISNAAVHLAIGYIIYKLNLVDKSVFQFVLGLAFLFFTIAIPIELDGSWVTVLWTLEATTLFYIAYNTNRQLYLDIALPLVIISVISLLQDWYQLYPDVNVSSANANYSRAAFANLNFVISLFVCACLGFIGVAATKKFASNPTSFTLDFFTRLVPIAGVALLYFTFINEISFAFNKSISIANGHKDFNSAYIFSAYKTLTSIIFSTLFVAAWLFINTRFFAQLRLRQLPVLAALFANLAFLFFGLYTIGQLRENYIANPAAGSKTELFIRYLAILSIAVLWAAVWNSIKTHKPFAPVQQIISAVFNITFLAVISNEFIQWMDLAGYHNQYKLGLSLIAGAYALALLFTGIVKKKKHLRISAIVLFAATLLKLFFYDLASLSTISKTIVLVLLGILLLFASFLYNKYKGLMSANDEPGK